MKLWALFLLAALSWFPTNLAPIRADNNEVPATQLHRVFPYDKLPDGQSTHSADVQAGDLIQISIPIPASRGGQKNPLLGLNVAIDGNSVEKLAVAYMPVEKRLNPATAANIHQPNLIHADLSCFLKAIKKGKTTVKITIVDPDGKEVPARPAQTVIVNVVGDLPEEQVMPTTRVCRGYPYDKVRDGAETHTVIAWPDDLIQLHVPSTIVPKGKLRGIKVEIDGDAVIKLAAVMPVDTKRKDDPNMPLEDEFTKDIRCILKAVKPGKATVKITPVDKDGKEKAAGTVVVEVREKLQPKK